jgi:hypothetical protein
MGLMCHMLTPLCVVPIAVVTPAASTPAALLVVSPSAPVSFMPPSATCMQTCTAYSTQAQYAVPSAAYIACRNQDARSVP